MEDLLNFYQSRVLALESKVQELSAKLEIEGNRSQNNY